MNGQSSSFFSGITTPISLCNIDKNYYSVKNSTQFQSSKIFPEDSIGCEGINSMSGFIISIWRRSLLNPQLHINLILLKLFHKIVIIPVHQFIITTLLITFEIQHMKYMYHQLTMTGDIMPEKIGRDIWIVIITGIHIIHWSNMYRNWMEYVLDGVIWTTVCSSSFIIGPELTWCSLFVYCYEGCIF